MFLSSFINTPLHYKTPDLKDGEVVVVHSITSKQHFINLKFNDKDEVKNIPNLIIGDSTALSNRKIKTQMEEIKKKLLMLDNIYTCYSYLFVTKENELYLVSMAMESITLSFETTTKIGQSLGIPILAPMWSGLYTPYNINAFLEDIFIQRL